VDSYQVWLRNKLVRGISVSGSINKTYYIGIL
jgi:hypothetical protein